MGKFPIFLFRAMLGQAVVNWFFVIGTVSESYTRNYVGYTFTYPVISQPPTKYGAQTWCSRNGSNLLEIKSSYVQTLIVQFLSDTGISFADGSLLFTSGVRNDGSWNWVSGRGINSITVSDQETGFAKSFGYISLNPSRINIVASTPIETRGYVCQGKFNCTAGFMIKDMCYKSYISPATTWFDARNRCLNEGGDLASFDFITDYTGLNTTLNRSWFNSSTTYWIGIRRQWWIWQSSNLEVNYTNWQNGRPGYRMDDACLCLTKNGTEWQWIERDCNNPAPFLCMTEPPATPSILSLMTQFTNITSTARSITYSGLSSFTAPDSNPSSSSISIMEAPLTSADRTNLGIGIGVGIGGALIIAGIIIAVIAAIMRKRGCPRKANPPDVILHPLESHYAEIPKQTGYETGSTPDANYNNLSTSPVVYSDLEILTGSSPSDEKDSFSLIGSKTATLAPPNGQKGTTHFTVDGQEYAEVNKEVLT